MEKAIQSLSEFPEVKVNENLQEKLYTAPLKRKKFRFGFDFLLNPALQPVYAVASVFLVLISFYFFNPNRDTLVKSIDKQIHIGFSKLEKLYTEADSFKDNLVAFKDSVLDSLQQKKEDVFGDGED